MPHGPQYEILATRSLVPMSLCSLSEYSDHINGNMIENAISMPMPRQTEMSTLSQADRHIFRIIMRPKATVWKGGGDPRRAPSSPFHNALSPRRLRFLPTSCSRRGAAPACERPDKPPFRSGPGLSGYVPILWAGSHIRRLLMHPSAPVGITDPERIPD